MPVVDDRLAWEGGKEAGPGEGFWGGGVGRLASCTLAQALGSGGFRPQVLLCIKRSDIGRSRGWTISTEGITKQA